MAIARRTTLVFCDRVLDKGRDRARAPGCRAATRIAWRNSPLRTPPVTCHVRRGRRDAAVRRWQLTVPATWSHRRARNPCWSVDPDACDLPRERQRDCGRLRGGSSQAWITPTGERGRWPWALSTVSTDPATKKSLLLSGERKEKEKTREDGRRATVVVDRARLSSSLSSRKKESLVVVGAVGTVDNAHDVRLVARGRYPSL